MKTGELFPACAGVIPPYMKKEGLKIPFPRVCGGDPVFKAVSSFVENFSPRVRG